MIYHPTMPIAHAPRILVCTADVGCGHGRAAAAITLALRKIRPDVNVRAVDALASSPFWFSYIYRDAYLFGARKLPRINGWLYDWTDVQGMHQAHGWTHMLESRALRNLRRSDLLHTADVVVCTHFLCARVLSRMRCQGALQAKLAVVVTDQHPHAVWRTRDADLFIVASDAAARELIRHGVSAERVVATGIPIDSRFDQPMSQASARQKHHIPPQSRVVLLCGGGLGLGGIEEALHGLLTAGSALEAIVVCGSNERLRRRLVATCQSPHCHILGRTSRMHELMAAADLLLGKPGGLTTSEAAVMGLPMVLLRPMPGQEDRNAQVLVDSGVAILRRDPYEAGQAAAGLVLEPDTLLHMRRAALRFARPGSAQAAAQALLDLAGAAPLNVDCPHPPVDSPAEAFS